MTEQPIQSIGDKPLASIQPRPGDIYRDYSWGPGKGFGRITGANPTAKGALAFLPNPVLPIGVEDLDQAVRAELIVELLQSHPGTRNKRFRLNDGDWTAIPEPSAIPGEHGSRLGTPQMWNYMIYPAMSVPVGCLQEGENKVEFAVDADENPKSLGGWWPQSIHYGVTLRVHYAPSKARLAARVTSPSQGDALGASALLTVETSGPGQVQSVDFIGEYLDFDWNGDGVFRDWQGHLRNGALAAHAATATQTTTAGVWAAHWDTTWLADQPEPMRLVARVVDETGLCHVTSVVDSLTLAPRDYSVGLFRPYAVLAHWQSRANGTDGCLFRLTGPIDQAKDARLILPTWNGDHCDRIMVNEQTIAGKTGLNHDLSYDTLPVPVEILRKGMNSFATFSTDSQHGVEVLWPGPVMLVRLPLTEK